MAGRPGGGRPALRIFDDADVEAREVARSVEAEIRGGTPAPQIAVFFRVNSQSRPFEDALRSLGIPYVLRGGLSFYDRAVVRDAVAYLKWAMRPDDLVMLRRVLKNPRRGVGEAALGRAKAAAKEAGVPVSEMLASVPGLAPLYALRGRWEAALPERGVGEALRALLSEAGYLDVVARRGADGEPDDGGRGDEDRENLGELFRLAAEFPGSGPEGVSAFLERVSLSGREMAAEGQAAVRLMTLHAAKGLEFGCVFLTGVEEGLLPHVRSAEEPEEIEEERRLLYVGMTRAKERATISFARRRFFHGTWRETVPSRFLSDIPQELLSVARIEAPRVTASRAVPRGREERAPASAPKEPRRMVRHPVFGLGTIEADEGEGAGRRIIARFPGYGVKKILVRAVTMEFL